MISLQLGLQFCLRIDLDMLSGVMRTETQHKFTTRWQCNLRIKDLAPTLSECLFADLQQFTEIKKRGERGVFKDAFVPSPLYKAVSFNENHLVRQEQVGAKHPVSFITNSSSTNSTQFCSPSKQMCPYFAIKGFPEVVKKVCLLAVPV